MNWLNNIFPGDYKGLTTENSIGKAIQRFDYLPDGAELKLITN